MQEVRDLTTSMKEALDFIRKSSTEARATFASEVERAKSNVSKIHSMAQQLKDANTEIEAVLGTTGTNFPPPEEEVKPQTLFAVDSPVQYPRNVNAPAKADLNGVTINPEHKK
jgi:hypothetical protein